MIAAVLAMALVSGTVDAPTTVAMVLTTKGAVTVQRGKNPSSRVGAMYLLQIGDRLSAPVDGEATLMFVGDGRRERLKPKSEATIAANGCKPAESVEVMPGPKLPPANLESLRELASSNRGAVGVLNYTRDPRRGGQAVTPFFGVWIATDRPKLTWPAANADSYIVELFHGEDNKRLMWKATVKESMLAYPAKEKPLELGEKYQWRVTPVKGKEAAAEPLVESKFKVLTKREIDLLARPAELRNSKDPADILLAALCYEANRVYDEALPLYQRLAELTPAEANFQNALASYYECAGRIDLAEKARAEANKLRGPGDSPTTVAMILTTKGAVTVQRGKNPPSRVGAMYLLQFGDRLSAPVDGEATFIFLGDGWRERLKPKSEATVGASGSTPTEAVEIVAGLKLPPANMQSLRDLAASSRGAVGVIRGDPPPKPQVVTPLFGTTIMTDRPNFTWPAAGANGYFVELFSGGQGKDKRLLWTATVKTPKLAYPAKAKPLELGEKYQWRVRPLKGKGVMAQPLVASKFMVLTKGEIGLLAGLSELRKSKDPCDILLAALAYEAHGVYDEALQLFQRLAELTPGEASFQDALASYYEQAGRKDLAAKARAAAKKVRG